MATKARRDQTISEQLARGPLDLPFFLLVILLTTIGVIMVFSASSPTAYYTEKISNHDPLYYFTRQGGFAVFGIAAAYFISKINYQSFRWMSIFILGGAFVLMLMVYIPGIGVVMNNARRWIKLPVIPRFQPSEILKIGIVLYFSARLSKRDGYVFKPRSGRQWYVPIYNFLGRIGFLELLPYGLILLASCVLLVFQPHMSGIILVLVIGASVLFAGGVQLRWFAIVGVVVLIALVLILIMFPYMRERITSANDPWADPSDDGYQLTQSLMAIGSGGLTGVGFGKSRQKFMFLPEEHNDFIFAIVLEELGLIGGCLIIILFMALILRGYWIALHARDRFGSLLVVGIVSHLAVQTFFNIGVVTGLLPTTGISLPFFSYGGTALLIQLAEMGIVLSVSRQIGARSTTDET